MATLPSATVTIDDEAGAFAGGTGYCVVFGCVERNDDLTPRVFASSKALLAQHGYSAAADYAALHIEATKKPIVFVGLPTATPGAIMRPSRTGTGTSVITVAAGAAGVLDEIDAKLTVLTGGTVGTNGITIALSLDGGTTRKTIRLGTASTYAVPYVGVVISFAAGTLIAGDAFRFQTTAPMWDGDGASGGRAALAAQQKPVRTILFVGDLPDATFAGYVVTAVNAYETANDRFVSARAQVSDRQPQPYLARESATTLTFAEVGASGDTITRDVGSWIDDGFAVGQTVSVVSPLNVVTGAIATLTATVLTFGVADLVAEVTAADTVTIDAADTMAAWLARQDAAFASIDSQKRIDLGIGRLRKLSPITGWELRRPVQWAASIREYQHDIHIPTWRKSDGPLDGWKMDNADGTIVEFDERVDGGALAARFTCARTFGNGPNGAFIAISLTRAPEGSLLSRTHNMAVANLACSVTHAATENALGSVLELDDNGYATDRSLSVIEESVNTDLEIALLQDRGEGARASMAVWSASRTDVLNVPGAQLTGVLRLFLNGTLEQIVTTVKIDTAG